MNQSKRSLFFTAPLLAAMLLPELAVASTYTDDLTQCLVSSTTQEDKGVVVRWVFSTLALHPDAVPLASVTAAQRAEFNAKTARLFERLVTENCKTQTQAAVRSEGPVALQTSFRKFGEIATRELLTNPQVAAGLTNAASNLDLIKLMSVLP